MNKRHTFLRSSGIIAMLIVCAAVATGCTKNGTVKPADPLAIKDDAKDVKAPKVLTELSKADIELLLEIRQAEQMVAKLEALMQKLSEGDSAQKGAAAALESKLRVLFGPKMNKREKIAFLAKFVAELKKEAEQGKTDAVAALKALRDGVNVVRPQTDEKDPPKWDRSKAGTVTLKYGKGGWAFAAAPPKGWTLAGTKLFFGGEEEGDFGSYRPPKGKCLSYGVEMQQATLVACSK